MAVDRIELRGLTRWKTDRLEERDNIRDRRERALLGLAFLFVTGNAVAFSIVQVGHLSWAHLWSPLIWVATIIIAHSIISYLIPRRDPFLLPLFAFLVGWGLLLQDRLAPNFLSRQTLWVVIGAITLLTVGIWPRSLRPLQNYRYLLLTGGLLLMGITLIFGVNPSGSGAALWLPVPVPFFGRIYFQPSELLKILLVIFLASYFTEQEPLYRYKQQVAVRKRPARPIHLIESIRNQLPFLGPLLFMWGFTIILLVWQQDLGAATLFFLVFTALLYLATGSIAYVATGLTLVVAAGAGIYFVFDTVATPRFLSWLNPWAYASSHGYQIVQSLIAQAAGGLIGQGIGQGYPGFIPVVHSDFALAAIAEEWGLLGSLTIVACFALLAQRGLRLALKTTSGLQSQAFYGYIAAGITVVFSVQALLIMGGVTKLIPLTGITLPFVSYGGSSLLVSSLMVGLLLYLSANIGHDSPSMPQKVPNPIERDYRRRVEHLTLIILTGFMTVALMMAYWVSWRGVSLLSREDNPRLVEIERRVNRGRILDRDSTVLAESSEFANGYIRTYPIPEVGPALGYYSIRYGTAGIEQALDFVLRGAEDGTWPTVIRDFLHVSPAGKDVKLTLDSSLQERATRLMDDQTGAMILLELDEENQAEVLVMVSQPGYDPNELDLRFEELSAGEPGPLFNRVTQGLYQPGLILQPLILAAAIEDGTLRLDNQVEDPLLPVMINGQIKRCQLRPDDTAARSFSWADMFAMNCPFPLYNLGQQLGEATLDEIFDQFNLTTAPEFILPVAPDPAIPAIIEPGMAAIGQEQMTLSPLQVALAYAVLGNNGRLPQLSLVEAVVGADGEEQENNAMEFDPIKTVVSPETVEAVLRAMPQSGNVRDVALSVLAGPEGNRNTWYAGLSTADPARQILVLVLENQGDPAIGQEIGRSVLSAAGNRP
jgi:cell division protein FtsW (lipid II flippase)